MLAFTGIVLLAFTGCGLATPSCEPEGKCEDPNAVYKPCPNPCEPSCQDTNPKICTKPVPPYGCECKPGYIRETKDGGKCIPPSKCKECNGDPHAKPVECGTLCRPSCQNPEPKICPLICIVNGCECDPGYLVNEVTGKCVLPKECPGGAPSCGQNETYTKCEKVCSASYCPKNDSQTYEDCCEDDEYCNPGCVCKKGYLLISPEQPNCIKSSECPPIPCTRPHEEYNSSPPNPDKEKCGNTDDGDDDNYPPRCVCEKGYCRNSSGVCVPAPGTPCYEDANATYSDCVSQPQPTCDNLNPVIPDPCDPCQPGCVCKDGYILSCHGGKCIDPFDCPSCNGDPNAMYSDCASSCQPTCANPDCPPPDMEPCKRGCVCRPGYILSEKNGKCIEISCCPGGSPSCPANETYVDCEVNCPNHYCPKDDSGVVVMCMPPYPCRGGCVCIQNYLRRHEDGKCVAQTDCPPITCTRQHEVYNPTPPNPEKENCGNTDTSPDGNNPPRCVCEKGYCRNSSGVCVPAPGTPCNGDDNAKYSDCVSQPQPTCDNVNPDPCDPCQPGCVCKDGYILSCHGGQCIDPRDCPACNGDPNARYSNCTSTCQPTCARPDCPYNPDEPCVRGCVCKDGYILSDKNGKCVEISTCPPGCNDDYNATAVQCPDPCPSTCEGPNAAHYNCKIPCKPVGCQCLPGYIVNNGVCTLAVDCPGGDPCGPHSHFSACRTECPEDYCPDSDRQDTPTCDQPDPCYSGCVCDDGYRRKSVYEPYTCVHDCDCPPITCTRANEEYNSCPSCGPVSCDDLNHPPTCPADVECHPGCVCKYDHYRASNGTCVHKSQCPC